MCRVFKVARVFELPAYPPFPSTVRATRITNRGKAKRHYRATELLPRPRPQRRSKAKAAAKGSKPRALLQRNRNPCPSIADPVSRTLASSPSRRCAGTSSATGMSELDDRLTYSCMHDAYSVLCALYSDFGVVASCESWRRRWRVRFARGCSSCACMSV